MRRFALSLAFLFACAPIAVAAIDPGTLREAGDWRLSAIGGRIACTLTLTTQAGVGGYEVKAPLACRRAFPALRAVASWALDEKGGIVLTDDHAQTIVTFPAQAGGPYETRSPDGRTWRLEPLRSDAALAAPVAAAKPASAPVAKPLPTPAGKPAPAP